MFWHPSMAGKVPIPQASIEFEVADVDTAATELAGKGCSLIHGGIRG